MSINDLPLKEVSISEIYDGNESATYEIPIYQRNYAWGRDEIEALVRDVRDAMIAGKQTYYIGTLVTFAKGDRVYEVIDGQQRLTTIYLVLRALGCSPKNKLTYRARKKSDITIKSIPEFNVEDIDSGIKNGFKEAQSAIESILMPEEQECFTSYFRDKVHIIHYNVPKDIDLNHYFEVMNSRGEQLEKHEIVKAQLISMLENSTDRAKFAKIWEACSQMNVYIQQKMPDDTVFGKDRDSFHPVPDESDGVCSSESGTASILSLIREEQTEQGKNDGEFLDTFQPIIDFPNFLLIVLKITLMQEEKDFEPADFILDDKELINEFEKAFRNKVVARVKNFGCNLLKARFLLDNYVVHHSNEDDVVGNNPWKLQTLQKEDKGYSRKNLVSDSDTQNKLVQLLSMFEVSFTPRQRKNYLFYTLYNLIDKDFCECNDDNKYKKYVSFLEQLAKKYVNDVYLVKDNLNQFNVPKPGSFDERVLASNNKFSQKTNADFNSIYGDGEDNPSKGIPLFIFNYMDYRIWAKYVKELKGEKSAVDSQDRKKFFDSLGCGDFGLEAFNQFYFSRTRRSLEHYFPQSTAKSENAVMTETQINGFGNYAMIGSAANSSGSNWSPKTKLDHYLDPSGKIQQISVASLKFRVMMQMCKDNIQGREEGREWTSDDAQKHQGKMIEILMSNDAEQDVE